jgi:eukaryotic-like serine/threonine-protein kinase
LGTVLGVPPASTARITLPDRYRIVRHIANGGMAGVWEAHDELLGRSVAVKVLASHLAEDDRARRRFEREARAAAGLSSHQHVVTIYDVGEHDGRVFMVMELMRGGTVGERLKEGRAIADETALRWLREAASALDAAHEAGIVHRDIKPGNLLLDDRDRLAIADFGIARLALEDQLTATGQVLGTASYISPEQAVGKPASAASDRYALAVVAFELLTGSRPFQAEHFAAQARAHVEDLPPLATERDPSLPLGFDPVLDRGLAKEPDERWPSASAMIEALDRAMGSSRSSTEPTRPVAAPTPGSWDEGPTPRAASGSDSPAERRGGGAMPWLLAGIAALVVLAVAAAMLLSGGDGGEPQSGSEPTATPTAEQTPERTPERTPEPTATPTAEQTPEQTPEPTAEATPEAPAGTDLDRAADLQLQGYNARLAGNYESALGLSTQALEACGDTKQLSPCGYALYEVGAALNALGRPDEAIPYLQQRLDQYGPNRDVEKELKRAEKAAGED